MIKKLAEYATVPIATCLDHGNDDERVMYAFRNGFTSIMYDGSLLPMEENIAKTKAYADLCHQFGMGIEGELGHVGIAMNGDDKKGIYTDPKDAANFVRRTGVDCIAIAVGTAHGDYPAGIIPHINFDCIPDLIVNTGMTTHAQNTQVAYVWNPVTLQFYRVEGFMDIVEPTFNKEKKEITTVVRDGYEYAYFETYKWVNGVLKQVSSKREKLFDE